MLDIDLRTSYSRTILKALSAVLRRAGGQLLHRAPVRWFMIGGMAMSSRGRPTLENVAQRAGVSRATASRVVNGSTSVAPHIRDKVHSAVEALGYVPNQAARSLVTQRTDSIALVASETTSRVFSDDPFFAGIIRGVSLELEAADKQLVLMMVGQSGPSHDRVERYATGGHVDGVIIFSMHGADPLPERLSRAGVPVVCNGWLMTPSSVPCVDVENEGGTRAAVRYLIDQGRRRVATISGPQDMSAGIDRLKGYRAEMTAAGRRSLIALGDFTRASGVQAMNQLLTDDPQLDAVFVANDPMAEGALRALRKAGRRVPDDVAVVGFDDMDFAKYTEPPLTTVRQPIAEIGHTVAQQVLRLAAGEEIERVVVLPTELVVRESA
jgi:DNA-binding LacI/PurR family transcriptional regulator